MRLLKRTPDGDIQLISVDADEHPPPYAILSHTWDHGHEITYNELVAGAGKDKTGYAKIRFCVDRAAKDGIEYSWVDTCCIDRSVPQELQTAINSMFRWYESAARCYVYLSDVHTPKQIADDESIRASWREAFRCSRWFTRAWTLQELLAPATVEFFSREGTLLGTKVSLEEDIHETTGIPKEAIRGLISSDFTVDVRMGWALNRTATFKEDKVYCLLGLFGVFLPLIYGEGEAHAESRLREEIQKQKAGERMQTPQELGMSSPLPFPPNEFFTGRESELETLEQFLLPGRHRRISICGLGGCGKSALAIELAYRVVARDVRRLVLWVPAISRESFELAYREIGMRLGVRGITDDNADVKLLVKNALSSNGGRDWLMIVDNADDLEVLISAAGNDGKQARLVDYLPTSNQGKIIFTTRSRKAAGDLTQSSVLELQDLDRAEARRLLALRITKQELLDDKEAVDVLLELLAYLPLAIVQAAAFINNNKVSVSEYVSLFKNTGSKTELFSERFEDPSRYQEMDSTIARTWRISFEQIRRQHPLAADYLSFMACINRINIPQSLLPPEESVAQQAKALGTLKGYAFITEQRSQQLGAERFFDMHRLIHMTSAWWLESRNEQAGWGAKAAARLEALVPYGDHESKDVWLAYLSHAIHLTGTEYIPQDTTRASLLERVGYCQQSLGQYTSALATHRQALSLRQNSLGEKHPLTLESMDRVASALTDVGRYDEAEAIHREVLMKREEVLGPEHPNTLTSINNLACTLQLSGKYIEAESLHRRALVASEETIGTKAYDTLLSMENLAQVLHYQGKYETAETMYRQVLAMREEVLGKDNKWTPASMHNLGAVLHDREKYAEAEIIYRQSLAGYQKLLNKKHPWVLANMSGLAEVLNSQGKYKEAEAMQRQTLASREETLGTEHPDTLWSLNSLAKVLGNQGKHGEAEKMHRQTLVLREKVLGVKHPDTLGSVRCLARLLAKQHRYDKAGALYQRACADYKAVLGLDHPTTRACSRDYSKMIEAGQQHLRA